jgi:hypothetical protein
MISCTLKPAVPGVNSNSVIVKNRRVQADRTCCWSSQLARRILKWDKANNHKVSRIHVYFLYKAEQRTDQKNKRSNQRLQPKILLVIWLFQIIHHSVSQCHLFIYSKDNYLASTM